MAEGGGCFLPGAHLSAAREAAAQRRRRRRQGRECRGRRLCRRPGAASALAAPNHTKTTARLPPRLSAAAYCCCCSAAASGTATSTGSSEAGRGGRSAGGCSVLRLLRPGLRLRHRPCGQVPEVDQVNQILGTRRVPSVDIKCLTYNSFYSFRPRLLRRPELRVCGRGRASGTACCVRPRDARTPTLEYPLRFFPVTGCASPLTPSLSISAAADDERCWRRQGRVAGASSDDHP